MMSVRSEGTFPDTHWLENDRVEKPTQLPAVAYRVGGVRAKANSIACDMQFPGRTTQKDSLVALDLTSDGRLEQDAEIGRHCTERRIGRISMLS